MITTPTHYVHFPSFETNLPTSFSSPKPTQTNTNLKGKIRQFLLRLPENHQKITLQRRKTPDTPHFRAENHQKFTLQRQTNPPENHASQPKNTQKISPLKQKTKTISIYLDMTGNPIQRLIARYDCIDGRAADT